MSVWFTTDFETGTIGSNLDTGMLAGFDASMGATGKCTFVTGLRGSVAMQSATGATGEQRSATKFLPGLTLANTLCVRGYAKMSTAVTHYGIQVQTAGAARCILQINSDGSVRMRSNSAALGTALGVGAINSSTPTRVEWLITATTQRVRLFTGANQHGTTPDYDSGDVAWTPAGTFDRFTIGNASGNANTTIVWDDVAADNTTWVGPVVTNVPPVANAGADRSVTVSNALTLDSSGSTDSDGTITGYLWSHESGTAGSFSSTTAANPTWTASGTPGTVVLGLIVTDNLGATSTKDTMSITVSAAATMDAGPDQTVEPWATGIALAAVSSNGTYSWSQTAGTTVTLSSTTIAGPTFTAPPGLVAGETLTFRCQNTGNTASDTVSIIVLPGNCFVKVGAALVGRQIQVGP